MRLRRFPILLPTRELSNAYLLVELRTRTLNISTDNRRRPGRKERITNTASDSVPKGIATSMTRDADETLGL
jgi:hypothetical protein